MIYWCDLLLRVIPISSILLLGEHFRSVFPVSLGLLSLLLSEHFRSVFPVGLGLLSLLLFGECFRSVFLLRSSLLSLLLLGERLLSLSTFAVGSTSSSTWSSFSKVKSTAGALDGNKCQNI